MPDIVVEPGKLENALRQFNRLQPRGYLALHDAHSRRFESKQERARLRRRKAERKRQRAARS